MNTFQKIGTDAEYFVADNKGISSAIGLIGGSKSDPKMVPYGNLQEDNVLAEFAIDPVESKSDWISHVRIVSSHLRGYLRQKHYAAVLKSSHIYDKEQLKSFGSMAMYMGCEPDYNVYADEMNEKPIARTTLRTAAGHIHFSYENPNKAATDKIVKCLDYMLGVWSVMQDPDKLRRQMYGKAGSCRYKEYGGEYRTLGNFWIATDAYLEYVYDVTKACVIHADALLPRLQALVSETSLQKIINDYDEVSAKVFYSEFVKIYEEVTCGA